MDGNAVFFEALTRRDAAADGVFFYAVRSTGVYCRPSCPARNPLAANTAFFPSARAAEAAGFRACKRCRPDGAGPQEAQAAMVAAACRRIEAAAGVKLAVLAAAAGVSVFHFHRIFKDVTGVTPKRFFEAKRAERVRQALGEAPSVTAAIYDAGYESSGRFYAAAGARLGMAPAVYAKAGAGERIGFAVAACSLGFVLVGRTEKGVCAIALGDDPAALEADFLRRFSGAVIERAADAGLLAQVVALVDGVGTGHGLPLDIQGTAFQQRVWAALQRLPRGRTASYAEIAAMLGVKGGARAVAGACAANRLAVAVPCHRVVRGDGQLAGYRWGVGRKRALLAREQGGG